MGNWDNTVLDSVTETRTHNSINELTQRTIGQNPAINLSYDDAGNVIQDGDANGDHKYTWDYRNRLLKAEEKQSGSWVTAGEYKYDPQGRRVRKVVSNKGGLNGTTRFIWGGDGDWQCLEERDGNDALVARFTYSPGYIDAVAVQERDLNADSDFGDTNEVVYYHQNALFSVYALSDGDGEVVERYRFDAYGGCTVLDPDGSADADGLSDVKNPYTFTGRRLDPESGLMQYRHRCYSPVLGRFVSRDPLGYGDMRSLYAGLAGRPTLSMDPLGTVEVGNPKLPHYFEPYPGVPAVITGTIWEIYNRKGQTIFREGRAGISWGRSVCGSKGLSLPLGPNWYQYTHSGPMSGLDPSGMWSAGDHEGITRTALGRYSRSFWIVKRHDCSYVRGRLADASSDEPDPLEAHYNRPRDRGNSLVSEYNDKYTRYMGERRQSYSRLLGSPTCDECHEALNILGNLVHAWEDYYAHAVLYGTGLAGPAWSARPQIRGSPDWLNPALKPCSWGWVLAPGEHGWGEPVDEVPGERAPRREEAESFVFGRSRGLLGMWLQRCYCCCPETGG